MEPQAWQDASQAVQISVSQRHVLEAVKQLGLHPQLEHKTPAPTFSIDVALPDHKVAIEVSCTARLAA